MQIQTKAEALSILTSISMDGNCTCAHMEHRKQAVYVVTRMLDEQMVIITAQEEQIKALQAQVERLQRYQYHGPARFG